MVVRHPTHSLTLGKPETSENLDSPFEIGPLTSIPLPEGFLSSPRAVVAVSEKRQQGLPVATENFIYWTFTSLVFGSTSRFRDTIVHCNMFLPRAVVLETMLHSLYVTKERVHTL